MVIFSVQVQDIAAREHIITGKCRTPIRREPFYHHLSAGMDLSVINVDMSLPIYRMANWRTRTKQLDYVHRENLPHEYFQRGEEDIGPQRVQHEILVEFANRGRGETIIPIVQKLKKDRRQMEPLLVTSSGVVVNGNRRLAAMRELSAEAPGIYPFNPVQVQVLPPGLTSQELQKIEFQLQMQQETKLPYDWAIQCLSVRELAEAGTTHPEIIHMMRLDKPSEVQDMINRLNEAELYLSEYLKTPENYSAIEKQEQQFFELQKALDRKTDAGEKELARKMCHVLTKHSRDLDTRVYDFKIAFGTKVREVAERLAERMDIDLPAEVGSVSGSTADAQEDDIFANEEAAQGGARLGVVRQILSDVDRSQELAEAIADICVEIKEESRGDEDARKPLKLVKKAKSQLSSVVLQNASRETIADIRAELSEVIAIAQTLLAQASVVSHM
ncbi:hypothetical protein BH09SUM1_BH09SUM1_28120 [soil metagenome]